MSRLLKANEVIVLVGVPEEISKSFPPNVIGITRTNNPQELAALYTRAHVVCSFSSAETFGLTIIEGYACGTPAVVYDNTAPPSLITAGTGFVVPNKDYQAAYQAIQTIKAKGKSHYSYACRQLVAEKYTKEQCFQSYLQLYEELLSLRKRYPCGYTDKQRWQSGCVGMPYADQRRSECRSSLISHIPVWLL